MSEPHSSQPNPQPPNETYLLDLINDFSETSTISDTTFSKKLAEKEQEYKFRDGERGERYRIHIHRIVVAGMYLIGAIMLALIVVRAYHFMVPDTWKWLTEEQNHEIERIIFSGLILSLASKYFKKYNLFEEGNKKKNEEE